MKRIVVVLLFVAGFCANVQAQSGRRAAPVPTPTPKAEEDSSFSESIAKPKQSRSLPSLRGGSGGVIASPTPQSQTLPGASTSETLGDADEVVRVETNLVTIPVSVFDRNGLYIPSLQQENFKIYENGKEQEIAYFGTTEQPFTVVLLLDTSPSTQYKIEEIQEAAIAFVNQLKSEDKVMVVEFDQNIHVLSEPTSEREKLYRAIRRADFGGGTSLYDAVDFALRKRLQKIEGRKAIVLFTDGVDTTSGKADYDSTLDVAEESEAIVFPIYYNTYNDQDRNSGGGVMSSPLPPIFGSPFPRRGGYPPARGTSRRDYAVGEKYLEELAAKTGGRVFPSEASGGLRGAFAGIAEELRRQYSIGYYPAEAGQNGQRRQIKVRVNRPNLVVRARDSYVVGAAPTAASGGGSPNKFQSDRN